MKTKKTLERVESKATSYIDKDVHPSENMDLLENINDEQFQVVNYKNSIKNIFEKHVWDNKAKLQPILDREDSIEGSNASESSESDRSKDEDDEFIRGHTHKRLKKQLV